MQYTIELNNHSEIFDVDKVAKQAAGAVLLRQGKSVVLATVAHEDKPVEEDFLPLTVQYIEKAYAAGRIPGGYIKRETKPSDSETLTARIIDRSLRPLFPKGYAYPTQIVVLVLSCDSEVDLQVMSLNAASVALYLSDIPMKAPVCGVRIARINDEFKLNPTNTELKKSTLDLFVSGVKDELLMIEMRALPSEGEFIPVVAPFAGIDGQSIQNMNELSEDEIVNALNLAQKAIENGSNAYEEAFSKHRKNGEFELKEEKRKRTNHQIYRAKLPCKGARGYHANGKKRASKRAKQNRQRNRKFRACRAKRMGRGSSKQGFKQGQTHHRALTHHQRGHSCGRTRLKRSAPHQHRNKYLAKRSRLLSFHARTNASPCRSDIRQRK